RDFERLFHDDMLAGSRCRRGRLQMRPAGSANVDDLEPRVREEFVVVGVNRAAADDLGDFPAVLGLRGEYGERLRPPNVVDRPRVKAGDHPAADNTETDFAHDLSIPFRQYNFPSSAATRISVR